MIVGSAPELAQSGKASDGISTHREGSFSSLERLAMPKGSVMLWDGMRANGEPLIIPTISSIPTILFMISSTVSW